MSHQELKLMTLENGLNFSHTSFSSLDFEKIVPLFETATSVARERVEHIKSLREQPNFTNVIEALETASFELDRLSATFFNLFSACTNDHIDKNIESVSQMLTQFSNDMSLDETLFEKVKTVYDQQNAHELSKEQISVLEKYYLDFKRNGALLDNTKKEQLRDIDNKLSQLGPQFSQNLLKATNAFSLHIEDEKIIKDLPVTALAAAKELAESRELKGWVFTLQAPSYIPFMTYCNSREMREHMWMAYNQRATEGEISNKSICQDIAKLRAQRAQLLGYNTHADFVLERRMAKDSATVYNFISQLKPASLAKAKAEFTELEELMKKDISEELMPWDVSFYMERLKKQKFNFNAEDLRPYFPLKKVLDGIFAHAQKLFGLEFQLKNDIDVYHKDVQVYEVKENNQHIGLLYFDIFPRDNKKGGAWMTSYLDQGSFAGKKFRPHISVVCNFTKPTKSQPSLLSFSEVETLFHEFGHALHGLLSDCNYTSVAGTNVLWDFVELPSQIMENWCLQKETLQMVSGHHETGESLPDELFQKIKMSQTFMSGYASLRQVSFCLIDFAWHDKTPDNIPNIDTVEEETLKDLRLVPKIDNTNFSVAFSHIFAGGYSAGYYSYKWAEVLDADAFEAFEENGIYDQETAKKFRDTILSKGSTEPPDVLYRKFRGRDPKPDALLKRSGLQ